MEEVGTMNDFKEFSSSEELAQTLAQNIALILENSIKANGKATLLVSGGNTPKLFFQKLSKIDIQWQMVTIGLVDERWLENDSKDSNAFLVKESLLINLASKASFVGLFIKGVSANSAQIICSKIYKKEFKEIDVLVLGMGTDGHTASLFPNNERLKEAYALTNDNFCISIEPKTAPYERMSLTLRKVLEAKNIILHIEGKEKLEVYNSAIKENDIYKYPVSTILNQSDKKIEVYYS